MSKIFKKLVAASCNEHYINKTQVAIFGFYYAGEFR